MPNSASAAKRVRQSLRRRARNVWRKGMVKAQVKSFLTALSKNDVPGAETEYRKTCSLLDRISAKGTIHANTAARRKSRLSRRLLAIKKPAKG